MNHNSDESNAWQRLLKSSRELTNVSVHELFQTELDRGKTFNREFDQIYVDFSKQRINTKVFNELLFLAKELDLSHKIKELVGGGVVNATEQRPALHTALRLPKTRSLHLEGEDIVPDIHISLAKMKCMVEKILSGQWRGYSGKSITDVVNIGVGGSDLGPFMVTNALSQFSVETEYPISIHFVSSMDGTQIDKVLNELNPETTLFLVSSKSFTTVDTFYNANTAISWLMSFIDNKNIIMKRHVIGISASLEKMSEWGIPSSNQLAFWDWVGGRFSLWSAIGMPIALKVGMDRFRDLLAGAHSMDEHFASADLSKNLPVILGLLAIWNSSFLNINAHTVLPYDGRLKFLPNYLTQLEMESNGKSVTTSGKKVRFDTCPILWGEIGPNAQHAFYQLLHQGTQDVSCDFIAPIERYNNRGKYKEAEESLNEQHTLALANCLAQSRVLAFGNKALPAEFSSYPKHKEYRGNQPSTTILIDELNPYNLGALIALYEHKVYVMASIWDINPFDQWGVELGKLISEQTLESIKMGSRVEEFDSSTSALLTQIRNRSKTQEGTKS